MNDAFEDRQFLARAQTRIRAVQLIAEKTTGLERTYQRTQYFTGDAEPLTLPVRGS